MLSPADVIIIGAVALIVFGPDQLPKVARRAGQVVRDVQNTSQTFVREMERAADESERKEWASSASEAVVEPHAKMEGEAGRSGFAPHERP